MFLFWSVLSGQNLFPILGGQRAGTSIFTFLKIGVSARAEGMGEAVVALHQNASSIYYNPATIAQFFSEKAPGMLLEKEIESLKKLMDKPKKPRNGIKFKIL